MKKTLIIILLCAVYTTSGTHNVTGKFESYLNKLSYYSIDFYMNLFNLHHKPIVLKQVKLESNHLKSYAAKNLNNVLGLTEKRKLIKFDNLRNCIKCYAKIQRKYRHNENYYSFLRRIKYAEDYKYIIKLKSI